MNMRQFQTRTKFETREADGRKILFGYFARFDDRYNMWPNFYETIDPHAFDESLAGGDVRALINHDTTLVLGRTKAGTLTLRADDVGIWGEIQVNEADADAMNCYARVKRGDVDQCSIGFDYAPGEGAEELITEADGTMHDIVKRAILYEVSVCTFPAYEGTSVEARDRAMEHSKRAQFARWKNQKQEVLKKWH